jgi:endonuclease/exonuclease/phosphatase family metal-dependent hydrolase
MARRVIIACCLLALLLPAGIAPGQEARGFVFYNVENLFDTRDDPATRDEEFTPTGARHWTWERYNRKLLHLSRALVAAGGEELPLFIGLAEVENRRVLLDLAGRTALVAGDYGVVHADSPDARGIDVALLYRRAFFRVLSEAFLPVPLGKAGPTRDLLYCKGLLRETDTLHLFVCHFPSMIGGERRSEWKRLAAAAVLRRTIDSIRRHDVGAAIILAGDLNGRPGTRAQRALGVKPADTRRVEPGGLYNTAYHYRQAASGSYRYQGKWQTLDHVIVSGVLLNGAFAWQAARRMEVYAGDFLLEEDKTHYGKRPFPTYRGPRYLGGYSDHLPVRLEFTRTPH